MSVERMRDGGGGDLESRRKRAIIRFAIWETLGFVPFLLTLFWLHSIGPERPDDELLKLTIAAALVFALYVGILFFRILLPVIKGRGNAR